MSQKSENTRDRIVEAAEGLIMGQGFAGTSIDDILKSAGLTKGAFFHHFKGKADLARVLVDAPLIATLPCSRSSRHEPRR